MSDTSDTSEKSTQRKDEFSCIAFIPVYNEADILPHVVNHLIRQGIRPYIIDNWSTDGCGGYSGPFFRQWRELFPPSGPTSTYDWRDILCHIEDLSRESLTSWCMLHDADEIRRSRRSGETLLEALERFDRDGATAANFEVYNFWPVDESWDGSQDPEKHFQYYEQNSYTTLPHVKAWKNNGQPLLLSQTGGHVARQVAYAEDLILKHYPIRSTAQAARKLDRDRFPRWNPEERKRFWHVQYDELVMSRGFIKDPKTLKRWKDG